MKLLQKTSKCALKLCFEAMEGFVGLCFLDFFSTIVDFKRFFENLKNDPIYFFKTITMYV